MTRPPIHFSAATAKAVAVAAALPEELAKKALLVRDTAGRLAIALDVKRSGFGPEISAIEQQAEALGAFASVPLVYTREDFFAPDRVFSDPMIVLYAPPGGAGAIRLLDRQITGQEWIARATGDREGPPRLAFYGFKGGVGRSTALAILAHHLAKSGKKVLLVDLDLESPGLSGLLIPPNDVADFGVVDWLVEDAVGQSDDVLRRLVVSSPLGADLDGDIRVVAAAGRGAEDYLDKLSRAYGDATRGPDSVRFSARMLEMLDALERQEQPDAVLIDSRAGLHDLAALSIAGMPSSVFLFATDTAAGWQGYRTLFSFWQSRPDVASLVRDRLKMVYGLFPERDQAERFERFVRHAHHLFTGTLYEAQRPGDDELRFNFAEDDSEAPHYPLIVKWNARFQEFDPFRDDGGFRDEAGIRAAYGEFIDGATEKIDEDAR